MTAHPKLTAALVVAAVFFAACTRNIDADFEVNNAQKAVDDFWRAIRTQDIELLSGVVANDAGRRADPYHVAVGENCFHVSLANTEVAKACIRVNLRECRGGGRFGVPGAW